MVSFIKGISAKIGNQFYSSKTESSSEDNSGGSSSSYDSSSPIIFPPYGSPDTQNAEEIFKKRKFEVKSNFEDLFDEVQKRDEEVYSIFRNIHDLSFKTEHLEIQEMCMNLIYGPKTQNDAIPFAETHSHGEGFFNDHELYEFALSEKFYYDKIKHLWRTGPGIKKNRYAAENTKRIWITKDCCVDLRDQKENRSEAFHQTFSTRGSIWDRIRLWKLLLEIMNEAVILNVPYRELFWCTYLLPDTLSSLKLESFANSPTIKKTDANIEIIVDLIRSKILDDILTKEEKAKILRKLKHQLGEQSKEIFDEMMKVNYFKAFEISLNAIFKKTKTEIRLAIEKDKMSKLDPDIFDTSSAFTLKLIFELSRHYSILHFFLYAISIGEYIKNNPGSPVVGLTVDGPEDHKNSRLYFSDHVRILTYIHQKYDVKITMHALELDKIQFTSQMKNTKDQLSKVLPFSMRVGHITNINETSDLDTNFVKLQNKGVEMCLTTIPVTTNIPSEKIPLNLLLKGGIPVSIHTDDQGVVFDQNGFTNISKEYIKAVKIFKLYYEDVQRMIRDALEYSFLPGNSIYQIKVVSRKDNDLIQDRIHIIQDKFVEIINRSSSEEFKNAIQKLSSKEQKQCQLERSFANFHNYVVANKEKFLLRTS